MSEGHGARNCALGCFGLLVLLGLGGVAANFAASSKLQARRAGVAQEVLALQQASAQPRPPLLGGAGSDENAVVDYNGLMWALTKSDPSSRPLSWRDRPPTLPQDIAAVTDQVDERVKFDWALVGECAKSFQPTAPGAGPPPTPSAGAQQLYQALRPALRYVRDGVGRQRCDWEVEWERGVAIEVPNLLMIRAVANLLGYEATTQPPREALETGLTLVAFAHDVERHGTLVATMIGLAVRRLGYQSLAHTLGREGLSDADLDRLVEVLAREQRIDQTALLKTEKLGFVVTILAMGGHPLSEDARQADYSGDHELGPIAAFAFLQERELAAYEAFMDRAIAILELPAEQQASARAQLSQDLESSTTLLARVAVPNLDSALATVDEIENGAAKLRVLVAAERHRRKTGAFPSQLSELQGSLGELPLDPRSRKPLSYRLDADGVWVYGVGQNDKDDGGLPNTDDSVLHLRAPAPR